MLRPATPLSILFFVAFCLLLLSTLSTPVIKAIPLATYRGINFGVLGYCDSDGCKGPVIGYDTEKLFGETPDTDFSLPSASRHALSSILIVHPVAALMALICFGLAVAAHFHSPAHSPRYLLALLIFTFPTLLVSLLAFLVDILLFVPHVAWGGWIVLAATIIIVASGIVTCAMRRTLVSRKARKRRIAENDDMNGQSYLVNRSEVGPGAIEFPKAESPPPLSNDTMSSAMKDNEYASFELQKQHSPEDMTPLNQRNPSLKTNSSAGRDGPDGMGAPPMRGPSGRGRQPVDQYGNPIPPMPSDGYMMNGPPRGRGSPYRGRGGYPPRGAPQGVPGRGGFGPRGGMRGPPPPGWQGNGRGGMRPGPNGQMGPGQMGPGPMGPGPMGPGPMGRGAPPPGYNNYNQGMPPQRDPASYNNSNNNNSINNNRAPPAGAPLAIGQAIEMDARTGTPPVNPNYGLRDSDDDVQGMLALQQGGFPASNPQRWQPVVMSPTSSYSQEELLPQQPPPPMPQLRQQKQSPPPQQQQQQQQQQPYASAQSNWEQQQSRSDQTLHTMHSNNSRGLSPIMDSPVEGPPRGFAPERSSEYYEDVDPKFAEPVHNNQSTMPNSLMPGNNPNNMNSHLRAPPPLTLSDPNLPRTSSYDDLPEGCRSPASSDVSHFTSISQRPINPAWRPEMGTAAGQFPPYGGGRGRAPLRPEDVILEANMANPDFALPGMSRGRGRGRGGRGGRGGAMAPPNATMMGQSMGLGAPGRYPGASAI